MLRHPHKIHIGSNVVIDDNCLLDAKGESNRGIRIGDGVFVGRNSILSCKDGDIELADGANIGFNCEVFSASRVTIGAGVLMAAYAYVIGGDHDFSDPAKSVLDQPRTSSGVTIGDGAWLGAGAKVLDGVTIGNHAVIGAGAVVREAVPDGAVAVGVPARVVRPEPRRSEIHEPPRPRRTASFLRPSPSRWPSSPSSPPVRRALKAGISSSPDRSSRPLASRDTTRISS